MWCECQVILLRSLGIVSWRSSISNRLSITSCVADLTLADFLLNCLLLVSDFSFSPSILCAVDAPIDLPLMYRLLFGTEGFSDSSSEILSTFWAAGAFLGCVFSSFSCSQYVALRKAFLQVTSWFKAFTLFLAKLISAKSWKLVWARLQFCTFNLWMPSRRFLSSYLLNSIVLLFLID